MKRTDDVAFHAFQSLVSLVLTLPLAAHWVAIWLGWRIFFLADPHIQFVWATLLLGAGAWPFAARALRDRKFWDGALVLISLALYGYGTFITFLRPEVTTHPYFQIQSLLILFITFDRLVAAVLERRRVRTN